ncbi:MAG: hypothetical protein L3J80_01035 [Thermoplasmata archaeon]|nr:hypothetical protein [Thermoplasmata archaeon]
METTAPLASDPARSVLSLPKLPPVVARNLPWLLLILCSITFAEFLTGSTPVLVPLLDPLSAVFLVGLYGAGVLLVREAAIRWNKGWPTVLLLGAAYGIAEEGIGTKTFFGPKGVGFLATYGHYAGVNWVWATELALFHAIFSIALPIAVVALMFPASARVSFLPTQRGLSAVVAVFVLTVGAMFVLFNGNEIPSGPVLLATLAAIGGLVGLARYVPARLTALRSGTVPSLGVAHPLVLGATFVWGFFGLSWIAPELIAVPAVVVAALVAWSIAFGLYVARHAESFGHPAVRLDFVLGALSFDLVLASVWGVLGDFAVLPVVAVVLLVAWRLRVRLAEPGPVPGSVAAVTPRPVG